MKEFAAFLRRILLAFVTVLALLLCITRSSELPFKKIVFLILIVFAALYIFISIISLLVRSKSRKNMNETDQMKDAVMGVLSYNKNGNVINYFRRLTFWGAVMAVVNFLVFKTSIGMIIGISFPEDKILSGYYGYLLWSIIGIVLFFILSLLFWTVYMPHYGKGAYTIFQYTGKMIVIDVIFPIMIILSFFGKTADGSKKDRKIVGLLTMVLFIAINSFAVIKQIIHG